METKDMKRYCISEIARIEKLKGPLLDIFYILLKANGKSYIQYRAARLKTQRQQLNLFEARQGG